MAMAGTKLQWKRSRFWKNLHQTLTLMRQTSKHIWEELAAKSDIDETDTRKTFGKSLDVD
eukprot:6492083-Amphidinium_carterae.2